MDNDMNKEAEKNKEAASYGKNKQEKFIHKVLIVDDDENVGKSIARILKRLKINFAYAPNGNKALEKVQKASAPFSIIISDQRMPGMRGSEFLEQARKISPDTIRFLVTGYSDMDAVLEAINKGAIHRYISKPWDTKEFMNAIQEGLKQFELIVENEQLLRLAKDQNTKLYELNCELREKTETHQKNIENLNREIDKLERQIKIQADKPKQDNSLERIEKLLKEKNMLEQDKLNNLYVELLKELFEQFSDIAIRNGFEMPESDSFNIKNSEDQGGFS